MTAQSEVSKEVASIGDKCGLDVSSYQDLPKVKCNGSSHCDQVIDRDNSYVFVTGTDGLIDDPVIEKANLVAAKGFSVESAVDVQIEKLDLLVVEVSESIKEGANVNVERSSVDIPLVNGNGIPLEQERLPEDGDGVPAVADAQEEQSEETEADVVSEIKPVEFPNGRFESLVEAETEAVGEQNGNLENVVETEIKPVVDSNGSVESSTASIVEMIGVPNGDIENVAETEIKQIVDPNPRLESSKAAEREMVGEPTEIFENEAESETKSVEDVNIIMGSSAGPEIETVGYQNGKLENVAETDAKAVENPNGMAGAEMETIGDQNENLENGEETVIEEVEDPSGRFEGLTVSEIETVAQNGNLESMSKSGILQVESHPIGNRETLEDETKAALSSDAMDNQKYATPVVQSALEQVDEAETVVGSADRDVEIVPDLAFNKEGNSALLTEDGIQCDKETEKLSDDKVVSPRMTQSETEPEASKLTQASSYSHELQTEIGMFGAEAVLKVASPPIQGPKSQIVENGIPGHGESQSSCTNCDVSSGSEFVPDSDVYEEKEPAFQCGDVRVETEASSAKTEAVSGPTSFVNVNLEPEMHGSSAATTEVLNSDVTFTCGDETLDGFGINNEDPSNLVLEKEDAGDLQDQLDNAIASTDETSCLQENEHTEKSQCDSVSIPSPEYSSTDVISGGEHVETEVSGAKTEAVSGPTSVVNVKLEPEVHRFSAATAEVLNSDVTVTCEAETLDGFDVNNKDPSNLVLEKEDARDLQDQLNNAIGSTHETSCLQENEDIEKSQSDSVSIPSPEGSSTDVISGGDTSIVAETKPFNCLVRVPRFGDESLKERIRLAKVKVDETTKVRDVIQVQIQEKRANSQTHGVDYEYAKREDRSARRLVRSKRMEIDSIQSVINKAKNATSIGDIDHRIYGIEHMIQHETLPLKEEKHLIREIKQLKQLREQLSANLGTKDEIKQALEQREEAEEHLKILRKELDVLKDKVLKAEATALEAERKYDDEIKKVKELQAKYRAADDVRQEAYAQWQSLRKELSEKNKYFFKYKDIAAAGNSYAYRRERESLYRLCTNQVDKLMELWNTNDEFRKEYVSFNARSTVRRFGTLDGRSLGPDEQPPFLPNYVDERVHRSTVPTHANIDSTSQSPPELKIETAIGNGASDDKPLKKLAENKNQTVKMKGDAKPQSENGLATVSGRDVVTAEVVVQEEEPVKSKEEIELARKAEEMRKQEAEAKLREQRRLEELVRAKEARERKKRQAEKLQMRAEMKAQKEAEQKEKEREKRMRKKERKKAGASDVNDVNNHSDSGESTVENGGKEIETTKDMPSVLNKKPQKSKQSKTKSVPPPLRNRNRKKWQQYMYVAAASFFVLVLFWVGNIGLFSGKNLKR